MALTYVFMKVTMYMTRGVQIIGWSVSMALMACLTQYSGFSGGNNGAISFLFEILQENNKFIKIQTCLTIRIKEYAVKTTNLILQPLNMPVSTKKGQTSVIFIPSLSAAFNSWLKDSWKPMAPNLLAQ